MYEEARGGGGGGHVLGGGQSSIKVNEDHRLVLIFRQSFETLGIIACRLKARQFYEEARLLDSEATHTKKWTVQFWAVGRGDIVYRPLAHQVRFCIRGEECLFFFRAQSSLEGNRGNQN